MSPKEIVALARGRELDLAVHRLVFRSESEKNVPRYSTSSAAFSIIEGTELPIAVGRSQKSDAFFNPDKPFFAEDRTPIVVKGQRTMRVIAATPEVALCKAACIYVLDNQPKAAIEPVASAT
jgi:hypothetical protein